MNNREEGFQGKCGTHLGVSPNSGSRKNLSSFSLVSVIVYDLGHFDYGPSVNPDCKIVLYITHIWWYLPIWWYLYVDAPKCTNMHVVVGQ